MLAHSLGTVVAYNVLRELGDKIDCRLLVTVGSPLGINGIKLHLESPLEYPAGVGDWYNARDERDTVALFPLDMKNFPLHSEKQISNYNDVKNPTDNRHGIIGYLIDRKVSGTTVGPFEA